jgi:hypothetical protein
MYLKIKYSAFYQYIINATTTATNTWKKEFDCGQREVITFFTLVANKGEYSIIYSKETNIDTVERVRIRVKHHKRCKIVKS